MDELKQRLFERLDENLSEYHKNLMGFEKAEIIDMADRAALMAEVHGHLTKNYEFAPGEVEYLLNLQNPLEAVTDAWAVQRADIADLDFIISRVCDTPDALRDYAHASGDKPSILDRLRDATEQAKQQATPPKPHEKDTEPR